MRFAAWITLGIACAGSGSGAWAVGPSFDCSKANTPGQQLICADADLSREDLAYAQAYYALRQQTGEAGWRPLKLLTIAYENQALQSCGVPLGGQLLPYPYEDKARCLEHAYESQRKAWIAGLVGPAVEEASRPVEEHVGLQAKLQELGYLPADETLDGVYGTRTRDAIERWQRANHRSDNGFITNSDAALILAEGTPGAAPRIEAASAAPFGTANPSTAPSQTWSEPIITHPVVTAAPQPASRALVRDDGNGSSGATATGVGGGAILASVVIGWFLLFLYFLPAIIGSRRQISSSGALFFVNLFLGWTVLGWLFCILWAATAATRGQDAFYNQRMPVPGPIGSDPMADPVFRESYARERARLDHEAGV
ncbi:MAG: superinfection immunity protein [Rhodopila sp.]